VGTSARISSLDDQDRQKFLTTLGEACAKTEWQVHACCLMRNRFHLVLETPDANLVAGMRWLLSAYTIRLNHRQKLLGHVSSLSAQFLLRNCYARSPARRVTKCSAGVPACEFQRRPAASPPRLKGQQRREDAKKNAGTDAAPNPLAGRLTGG